MVTLSRLVSSIHPDVACFDSRTTLLDVNRRILQANIANRDFVHVEIRRVDADLVAIRILTTIP